MQALFFCKPAAGGRDVGAKRRNLGGTPEIARPPGAESRLANQLGALKSGIFFALYNKMLYICMQNNNNLSDADNNDKSTNSLQI